MSLTENGEFLSLDLGGSKFRVLKVQVSEEGKQNVQMESQFYPMPNEISRGNGTEVLAEGIGLGIGHERLCLSLTCAFLQLFDYIADCLADFMKTKDLVHKKLPLGFTFSFPCRQNKLEEVRPDSWIRMKFWSVGLSAFC